MELKKILWQRRSVRRFLNHPVEQDKIKQLMEAALLSPSSKGINPWEFIVVNKPELIKQLSQTKEHGSTFIAYAPLAIVITADERKNDVWVEDCSIASIIIQLMAEELSLGSCWVQIRNRSTDNGLTSEQKVQQLLSLPEYLRVLSIIAVGYPAQKPKPYKSDYINTAKIHLNSL